ncbi:TonB-dependent receptor [Balneola vulgaris]|uniref:TonB-dependent receptor n=1 Tax=Balneola vulgaris TaxID=287535 RepID=UPI00037BBD6F|nr:TonB-dependent receptor [Balneola vulgaris]
MRELLLVTFLFIISVSPTLAQTVTVTDDLTGQPLEFVLIYNEDMNLSASTNSRGKADVEAFKSSSEIHFRLVGYRTISTTFSKLKRNDFEVRLIPSELTLDQMVVSAARWKQETREVPLKVTTIQPNTIRLRNPQTAADLLTVSGEVYVQKSQLGGGSPMIRGFATNRVLLAIDGVRMNTAIFRSGNVHNVISIDPFALQDTEIIFGPGSVIYGSDAIGGVMSFYSVKPQFATGDGILAKGKVVSRASSANSEFTNHGELSLGWKKFGSFTSVSYTSYDDLRIGSYGPSEYLRSFYVIPSPNGNDSVNMSGDPELQTPTGFNQFNLTQKLRWQPNSKWDINYGLHVSESSDMDRYDRLIRTRNGEPRSAEWYYGPQIWRMHNLNVLLQDSNSVFDQASLTLSTQFFEESRHDRDYQSRNLRSRTEQVDVYTLNLDLEKNASKKHRLFYGAEMVFNDISSTGKITDIVDEQSTPTSTRYPDGSDWNSFSGYLSHRFKISNQVTLQSGFRYSHFYLDASFDPTYYPIPFNDVSINEGAITGSAGISYSPDESLQMSANLSTGYRAPNIDDAAKVFDSEPGSVVVPNSNLKPEYAYNADIGFVKVINEALKIDLTGYYTILSDALIRRDFTINGQDSIMYDGQNSKVQAIQNAAYARVYGIQAGIRLELPSGFSLSSKLNIQKGEEEQEDGSYAPLRHAAPTFGSTHLTYTMSGLEVDLFAEYNGEIKHEDLAPSEQSKDYIYASNTRGLPYSPSWYTLNLNSVYQLSDSFMVSTGIDNITDQRYKPYSSGIAAPGRNFFLALHAYF